MAVASGWLEALAVLLPRAIAALALLALGWGMAALLRASVRWLLRSLGIDRAAARSRLADALARGGHEEPPSEWLGRLAFWLVILGFLLAVLDVLGLHGARETVNRMLAFLPQLLGATLIWLGGTVVARFTRGLVASAAAASLLPRPERLGVAAATVVLILAATLAIEQLGVDTALVVAVAVTGLATLGISAGTALALGARPLVTHILAGHYLRQMLVPGEEATVLERRGVVERVGTVGTEFRDGAQRWTVPNARLLDEIVER